MKVKKAIIPFIAGISAGAAAGYYLNSPEGKKQIKKVKKSVKKVESDVNQSVDKKLTEVREELQRTLASVQDQLNEVKAAGKSNMNNGKELISDVSEQGLNKTIALADKLKKHAEKAKAEINLS